MKYLKYFESITEQSIIEDLKNHCKTELDRLINLSQINPEFNNNFKNKLRTLKIDWTKIQGHGITKADSTYNLINSLINILFTGKLIHDSSFGKLTGGPYSAYITAPFIIITDISGKYNTDLTKFNFSVVLNGIGEAYYSGLKWYFPKVNFIKASELDDNKISNAKHLH